MEKTEQSSKRRLKLAKKKEKVQNLLNPFSKDQLITLATDLSLSHNSLFERINSIADEDIFLRKIFAHGLASDATSSEVRSKLEVFGEILDVIIPRRRVTGKCKGYAFITFKHRSSAIKLLKSPRVIIIGSRLISFQLVLTESQSSDYHQRRVYVGNVPVNTNVEILRSFFEKFGEIEIGPAGLNPITGKFNKRYAVFVFKTVEGAKNALEEPFKMFEGGVQLHCQTASSYMLDQPEGMSERKTAIRKDEFERRPEAMKNTKAKDDLVLNQRISELNEQFFKLENLNQKLVAKNRQDIDELHNARSALIEILSDSTNSGNVNIGVKMMGKLDEGIFTKSCKSRFPPEKAGTEALRLYSFWQSKLNSSTWYPFHIPADCCYNQEVLNEDDNLLRGLKKKWGDDEIYSEVMRVLKDKKEHNPKGCCPFPVLWNYKESRKATLEEVICYIFIEIK